VAALRLTYHFLHNRQSTVGSGTDHKPLAVPGYLFFDGKGRMPKLVTESLGRCFLPFADCSAVNDHVVVVGAAIDSERTEGKSTEVRTRLLVPSIQALFLEVMAEKDDQLCSTS
jgi:hypothetical protein